MEMGGCRPTRPVPVDEAGTFLVRHLTMKGERLICYRSVVDAYEKISFEIEAFEAEKEVT